MELLIADPELSKQKPDPPAPWWRSGLAWPRWVPWLILLVAAAFRFWELDLKPPHFDEGINGWFVDRMTEKGFYEYDPKNYHGPLHFYVLFVSQTLFGRNVWALRVPVVLVGLATIWLVWQFRRYLGDRAAALAALGLAVSPGYVFYQRYSIHEAWLVFFMMLTVWGLWGIAENGRISGLRALIIGVTGMALTKETYIIHAGSIILAFWVLVGMEWMVRSDPPLVVAEPIWTKRQRTQALLLAVVALLFFYSGNFFHWSSLSGLVTTFDAWYQTGIEGAGHAKKTDQWMWLNYFWVKLCWRYEPLALAGMVACFWAFVKTDWKVRWLAIYGVGVLMAYSLIPYKTPWCLISMAWPFYLLAGVLLDRALRSRLWVLAVLLLSGTLGYSVWRTVDLNWVNYDNDEEPYVYVQTYRDISDVLRPIQAVLEREPGRTDMSGHLYMDSYYPLPWIFGEFTQIGYGKRKNARTATDADFLICEEEDEPLLEKRLKGTYFRVYFRLRSGMQPCVGWFNEEMFAGEFPGGQPDFVGEIPVETQKPSS